jgi:hypothetical protein
MEEEIRERTVKGTKAFYANKTLFKSKLEDCQMGF